jgi:hypothetical protein
LSGSNVRNLSVKKALFGEKMSRTVNKSEMNLLITRERIGYLKNAKGFGFSRTKAMFLSTKSIKTHNCQK